MEAREAVAGGELAEYLAALEARVAELEAKVAQLELPASSQGPEADGE